MVQKKIEVLAIATVQFVPVEEQVAMGDRIRIINKFSFLRVNDFQLHFLMLDSTDGVEQM